VFSPQLLLQQQQQPSLWSVTAADYPALSNELGRLRGFTHRPKVDSTVRMVQQRFYHQPLALRQLISDVFRRKEKDGSY
jgi:hypothetical protein